MSKENKKQPEQRGDVATIDFDDYRITDHRDAPAGAVVLRSMLGGYKLYQDYCSSYNRLVDAVKESVQKKEMTVKDAQDCLEECREW